MASFRLVTLENGRTRYRRARRRPAGVPGQLSLFGPARVHVLSVRPRRSRKSDVSQPFEAAVALDLAGDAGAREAYRRAIEAGDRAADAWCNLGVLAAHAACDDEASFVKALTAFSEALALEPAHAGAHFNLGNLYLERAEPAPARVHFRVAATGGGAEATMHLALACAMLGDAPAAVAALAEYDGLAGAEESAAAGALVRRLLARR
jgi:hypothetical protein